MGLLEIGLVDGFYFYFYLIFFLGEILVFLVEERELYVFLHVLLLRKCKKREESLDFFLGNQIGEEHEEHVSLFF